MASKRASKASTARRLKAVLAKEPGQTIKALAARLEVNRQFMAGYLAALEEQGELLSRRVGPARIYFARDDEET